MPPRHEQSIWYDAEQDLVCIIDQTLLPHEFQTLALNSLDAACEAISAMRVRGAPLIGVTAVYGLYLALRDDPHALAEARSRLAATRPTAVNLQWALQQADKVLSDLSAGQRAQRALALAQHLERDDIARCEAIGNHGAELLQALWQERRQEAESLNVLTHCNAGALATVAWGTALAVVYKAAARGIPVHVWVDETRPRNQGAALTCWELGQQGIPHTLIVDNAGGHLMQQGLVDVCLVGSDRTTLNGDVCNKVGTYLKALAAHDNDVPFYVALPLSSIDFHMQDGLAEIPIEQRDAREVTHLTGWDEHGARRTVCIAPEEVEVSNFGFDVTPARLVSGIITECGVCAAERGAMQALRERA